MRNTAHRTSLSLRIALRLVALSLPLSIASGAIPSVVQDFGQAAVNGTGNVITISLPVTGLMTVPSVSIGGVDFSAGSITCNTNITICSVPVTFLPKSPGLKQDAVILKNTSGSMVALAFVHGLGTAPLLQILPASITTLAGNGNWNYVDGPASSASFRNPQGLAADLFGNIYVADSVNQVIRKIAASTLIVSTIAGNGAPGYSGDGGAAVNATLNTPTGLAVDASGNLFIADEGNSVIRQVDAFSGIITTVAGTSGLSGPSSIAIDAAGNLYISDSYNNVIRKFILASGLMTTVAGGGTAAGTDGIGDGGSATAAELSNPTGVTLDASGNLFFADTGHSMIRRVDAQTGTINVIAGTGSYGSSGDGGLATNASLASPTGVRLDVAGNLYIADMGAQVVRFVDSRTGAISTVAGNGTPAYTGDLGVSTFAALDNPTDVLPDNSGNLLIADYSNNVVRRLTFIPPALVFPSTSTTMTSAVVPVTLNNYGNAALIISSVSITAGFEQKASGGTDCAASFTLGAGTNCQIGLVFSPSTSGTITGNLSVISNTGDALSAQSTIALSGTALSGVASVSLSATSLTFPALSVGTTSAAQTLTLTNTGTAALQIATIQIGGINASDFNVSATTCLSSLSLSASCIIAINVKPSFAGSSSAVLVITDSAANSQQTVTLTATGTGGAVASFNTAAVQFGSQVISTAGSMQSVSLTNTGTTLLSIFSVTLTGLNAADFSIPTSSCGGTLAPAASCAVTVSFVPTALGTRTANLLFLLSSASSAQPVALAGTGLPPPCATALNPSTQSYPASGASDSVVIYAPSGCAWTATASASWINLSGSLSGVGTSTLQYTVVANTSMQARSGTITVGNQTETITQMAMGLRFIPMTPCRAIDTRYPSGPLGGPFISGNTSRDFLIPQSACGIPSTALAYALNVTVVPKGMLGYLSVWPTGQAPTATSVLNSDGRVKANAAIVPAGTNGGITIYASDPTEAIVDISGYFVPASNASSLSFYPLAPCRVADTRNPAGPLGQPYLPALTIRNFPVQASPCNIPPSAQAYSLNFTVVPRGGIVGYLSSWPTGQPQPFVSTLNDYTGTVVANAAIVQAGTNGNISVFATSDTDVIIDINGYFAEQQTGGLSLYTISPCRVLDTRNGSGPPLDGIMSVDLLTAGQCPLPPQAQTFVLNATVVPEPVVGVLTLWPNGVGRSIVSTLNAFDGAVTSNLAIVPGSSGVINAYTSSAAHLILDMFGYFSP